VQTACKNTLLLLGGGNSPFQAKKEEKKKKRKKKKQKKKKKEKRKKKEEKRSGGRKTPPPPPKNLLTSEVVSIEEESWRPTCSKTPNDQMKEKRKRLSAFQKKKEDKKNKGGTMNIPVPNRGAKKNERPITKRKGPRTFVDYIPMENTIRRFLERREAGKFRLKEEGKGEMDGDATCSPGQEGATSVLLEEGRFRRPLEEGKSGETLYLALAPALTKEKSASLTRAGEG